MTTNEIQHPTMGAGVSHMGNVGLEEEPHERSERLFQPIEWI